MKITRTKPRSVRRASLESFRKASTAKERVRPKRIEDATQMAWPLDYVVAAGLTLTSFLMLYVRFWFPPDKMFDEVYFARAAEEYLHRQYIYENTHPPVTKLLITLSTLMFGDNPFGWRFLDVVFGAVAVWLLYALLKRVTGSTLFSAYGAALFMLDGMHFVQSRIATPESFVVVFALATLYSFYRYWIAAQDDADAASPQGLLRARVVGTALCAVAATVFVALRFPGESAVAKAIAGMCAFAGAYLMYRVIIEPRVVKGTASPAGRAPGIWLTLFAVSLGLLVASKWYGVMVCGVAVTVVLAVRLQRRARAAWGNPAGFRLDLLLATVVFVVGAIYFAAYTPQFIGLSDTPGAAPRAYSVTDVLNMQYSAFEYHNNLRATHPYQSAWWQWPLDLRPLLYYAKYGVGAAMIYTLPNPFIMWLGLLTVPLVGFLGVREKNKAYALIVLTYIAQWLPWMGSPRIAFAYHFYVDIPLICACSAIVAQRLWRAWRDTERNHAAVWIIGGYFAAVLLAFVYFYPILSGMTITSDARLERMWLPSWI